MKTPILSIIIPVYKTEKFLKNCIESILNQTFKEYELILVDDGSPDNCGSICDEYAKKNNRITVIHKKNGGLSSARNAGLDIAKGNYITFVDSDDTIENNTYQENISFLLEHPETDVLQYPIAYHKHNNDIHIETLTRQIISGSNNICSYWFGHPDMKGYAFNRIYKKNVFSTNRFPENILYPEDLFTLINIGKEIQNLYISNRGRYNYYLRDNSLSSATTTTTFRHYRDYLYVLMHGLKSFYAANNQCSYIFYSACISLLLQMDKSYFQKQEIQDSIEQLNFYAFPVKKIREMGFSRQNKIVISLIQLTGIKTYLFIHRTIKYKKI